MAHSRQLRQNIFDGNVAHLRCGLTASTLHADEFVVAPERTVEKKDLAGVELLNQRVVEMRNGRHIGKSRARWRFDQEPQGCFASRELRLPFWSYICGIMSAQRNCATANTGVFATRIAQTKFRSGLKFAPHGLIRNALQHREHGVVFTEDAANGSCGVNAQWLEFAQQKESEDVVDVGIGQYNACDGRLAQAFAG